MTFKELGQNPYKIKFNDYFVIHKDKDVWKGFLQHCQYQGELVTTSDCTEDVDFTMEVKNKVGLLVTTYEFENSTNSCGGQPSHGGVFKTYDLRDLTEARLTNFFDEKDFRFQLLKDKVVRRRMDGFDLKTASLDSIIGKLELKAFVIQDLKLRKGRIRLRLPIAALEGLYFEFSTLGVDCALNPGF